MSQPKRKRTVRRNVKIQVRAIRREQPDLDRMRRALLNFVLDEQRRKAIDRDNTDAA